MNEWLTAMQRDKVLTATAHFVGAVASLASKTPDDVLEVADTFGQEFLDRDGMDAPTIRRFCVAIAKRTLELLDTEQPAA